MASKNDVVINVIAETKKAVAGMAVLALSVGAVVLIAKKLTKIGGELIEAFGVQEQAQAKLAASIRATGKEQQINQGQLEALASSLQKVTTFGDEVTISATAMLQQLADLNQEGLEKVIPSMQDFAAAMGVDLNTAATLIGKTLGSSTNALSRYGIEIDATASTSDKLVELTQAMDDKFGGMAATIANTSLGTIVQLQNAFGDLKEEIGETVAVALNPVIVWLRDVVTETVITVAQMKDLKASIKAFESGDFTLADEINVAASKVDRLSIAFEKAKADSLELENAFGKIANVSRESVQDAIAAQAAAKTALDNAKEGLGGLIGQREIEIRLNEISGESANKLLREQQALRDQLSLGLLDFNTALSEQQRIFEESLTPIERQREEYQRIIDKLADYRQALRDADMAGSQAFQDNRALINFFDDLKNSLVDVEIELQGLQGTMVFADPVLIGLTREYGLALNDVNFAMLAVAENMAAAAAIANNELLPGMMAFADPVLPGLSVNLDTVNLGLNDMFIAMVKVAEATGGVVVPEILAADEATEQWELNIDNLGKSMGNLAASGTLTALQEMGASMAQGSTGAEGFAAGLEALGSVLLNTLPQLLLTAGLKAVLLNPADPLGWGLIAASGLVAFFSGAVKGGSKSNSAADINALPDADTIAAARQGVTFGAGNAINPQVTNNFNIAGNAFVDDELGSRIQDEVTSMNSGS